MLYLQLFYEFFKAGLFAVGGGLATIPFLFDISATTGWFTTADIMNLIAISESTPGALGVNMATYTGVIVGGVVGGIVATLGLVAPSIIIIEIIANALSKFKNARIVQDIFSGLRPASTGLIAAAGLLVAKTTFIDSAVFNGESFGIHSVMWIELLLAAVIWFGMKKFKKHPIVYIVFAGVVGATLSL